MITTYEKARRATQARAAAGKPGLGKAVQRFFKRRRLWAEESRSSKATYIFIRERDSLLGLRSSM